MSHDSSKTGSPHTIDRQVRPPSVRRSYVLELREYDQLIAAGLDPATVAEAELARRATCCRDFDDQGRILQVLSRSNPPRSSVYTV